MPAPHAHRFDATKYTPQKRKEISFTCVENENIFTQIIKNNHRG
ncbi:hypothetical protein CPter291_0627 [Collimonas pratensis]|uniref:Uncharacterized protein n=1 Tax=Collimonas pratensis TaxID=279113 RepID=A0ABM5Z1G8_9BURK|nr:hypothetical protein CPter291_0627 [Collimonas pratensis]